MELMHLGTNVLDVPPSSGNPRNSESAFMEMADGSLMLVYSRFIGDGHGDDANACLAARFSADNGETWSDDHVIARPDGEDVPLLEGRRRNLDTSDCFYIYVACLSPIDEANSEH